MQNPIVRPLFTLWPVDELLNGANETQRLPVPNSKGFWAQRPDDMFLFAMLSLGAIFEASDPKKPLMVMLTSD